MSLSCIVLSISAMRRALKLECSWQEKQDRLQPRRTPGYKKPEKGDLVLVGDFQQAKDKGVNLEPR